jgi:very-short-patch-repair endonuclease
LHDATRDGRFQREGFRVLRISNALVIGSQIAIRKIMEALNE